MYGKNLGNAADLVTLMNDDVTADGQTTGVDISGLDGQAAIVLSSLNLAGTTPTLALKLQESDVIGSGYTDVPSGAFTGLTTLASNQKLVINTDERKKYLRVDRDIAGTDSPRYIVSMQILAARKVND